MITATATEDQTMSDTPEPELERLRTEHEQLRIQVEIQQLTEAIRRADLQERTVEPLVEGFQDQVDRSEYLTDSPGFFPGEGLHDRRMSLPGDRQSGANWPFWRTEPELAMIRGIGRWLMTHDEIAINAIENLKNYTIHTGLTVSVNPSPAFAHDEAAKSVAYAAQRAIEMFSDDNDWEGDLEVELFIRSRRDGEYFLALSDEGGGHVRAETIEPEEITEPADPRNLEDHLQLETSDWRFGVAKEPGRPARRRGFFANRMGETNDWEFYSIDQMCHARINVDRIIARGQSDFFAAYKTVESASKLLHGTIVGSTLQSYIALIREHAEGVTPTQITDFSASSRDNQMTVSGSGGTTKAINARRWYPGETLDVPAGLKYHASPLGNAARGVAYIQVVQAAMRKAGIRWSMPEYLISGDLSNANLASTMAGGAPFERSAAAIQAFYIRSYREVFRKVLRIAHGAGWFSRLSGLAWRDLWAMIDVKIDGPQTSVRDRDKDHQINIDLHDRGILSSATWAARVDLDYEDEVANGATPAAPQGIPTIPTIPDPNYATTEAAPWVAAIGSADTAEERLALLREAYP